MATANGIPHTTRLDDHFIRCDALDMLVLVRKVLPIHQDVLQTRESKTMSTIFNACR